jgi:hypothetical protein
MERNWEGTFSSWAEAPGKTEQDRIENTERAVRKALEKDDKLRPVTKVFVHGSYRNRVNVRQDSDVDVGILYTGNSFCVDYPNGKGDADFKNENATYTYADFKKDVGQALVNHFGAGSVRRGNKAFEIRESSYRVEADVVPFFIHRRYHESGYYICGVEFHPDGGWRIVNWPERLYDKPWWPKQHYENAVEKNNVTGRRYKGIVRILKKLRNEMEESGFAIARPISGFVIECMSWNVPNDRYYLNGWDNILQAVLAFLWSNTQDDESCSDWGEVSDLKYLFRGSPKLKREQAHDFINAAWDYVGVRS